MIVLSNPLRFLEEAATVEGARRIGDVPCGLWNGTSPPPLGIRLPGCGAAHRDGIPNRRIVTEIIYKVGASAGFVKDGNAKVSVEVAEVDYVWPAAEGAERRRAALDLGEGGRRE